MGQLGRLPSSTPRPASTVPRSFARRRPSPLVLSLAEAPDLGRAASRTPPTSRRHRHDDSHLSLLPKLPSPEKRRDWTLPRAPTAARLPVVRRQKPKTKKRPGLGWLSRAANRFSGGTGPFLVHLRTPCFPLHPEVQVAPPATHRRSNRSEVVATDKTAIRSGVPLDLPRGEHTKAGPPGFSWKRPVAGVLRSVSSQPPRVSGLVSRRRIQASASVTARSPAAVEGDLEGCSDLLPAPPTATSTQSRRPMAGQAA